MPSGAAVAGAAVKWLRDQWRGRDGCRDGSHGAQHRGQYRRRVRRAGLRRSGRSLVGRGGAGHDLRPYARYGVKEIVTIRSGRWSIRPGI